MLIVVTKAGSRSLYLNSWTQCSSFILTKNPDIFRCAILFYFHYISAKSSNHKCPKLKWNFFHSTFEFSHFVCQNILNLNYFWDEWHPTFTALGGKSKIQSHFGIKMWKFTMKTMFEKGWPMKRVTDAKSTMNNQTIHSNCANWRQIGMRQNEKKKRLECALKC